MKRVIAHDHRDKCPTSRFIRYKDERSANEVIRIARQRLVDDHTIPVRAYWHEDCNGWHLTSQQARENTNDASDAIASRFRRRRRQVRQKRQEDRGLQDDGLGARQHMPRLSDRIIDD